MDKKFFAAVYLFFAYCQNQEQHVYNMALASAVFIFMDTVLAVYLACQLGQWSSNKMKMGLFWKIVYYTGMMTLSYFVGFLSKVDLIPVGAWGIILLTEGSSMIETLTRIHVKAGKRFGLAEKFLRKVAQAMGEIAKDGVDSLPPGKG